MTQSPRELAEKIVESVSSMFDWSGWGHFAKLGYKDQMIKNIEAALVSFGQERFEAAITAAENEVDGLVGTFDGYKHDGGGGQMGYDLACSDFIKKLGTLKGRK